MKIGILSFAHMHAHSYASCLLKMRGVKLAAITDVNLALGQRLAAKYHTRCFRRYEELLAEDLDAVIITSENARHRDMALAAAEAGKAILCEKPLATTRDDAVAIIEGCKRHSVQLQMAFPCRFSTPIRRAKELLDSGALGRILAINGTNRGKVPGGWFIKKKLSGGGAVIDHTVHVVDLMRWMTTAEVSKVYAEVDTRFHNIAVDDCATLSLEFDNGVIATLDPSWSRPTSFPVWGDVTMEIICEGGMLFVDAFRQAITVYADSKRDHYLSYWGDNMDWEMLKHFVSCIREGIQPAVTGIDGLRALEVALAAYRSAKSRLAVSVNEL